MFKRDRRVDRLKQKKRHSKGKANMDFGMEARAAI